MNSETKEALQEIHADLTEKLADALNGRKIIAMTHHAGKLCIKTRNAEKVEEMFWGEMRPAAKPKEGDSAEVITMLEDSAIDYAMWQIRIELARLLPPPPTPLVTLQ